MTLPSDEERVERPTPVSRGSVLVLCYETVSGQIIGDWLGLSGWFSCSVTSARAAEEWLRTNRPDVLVVSGEYDLEVIASLRAVRPVNAVWITRAGAHRPAQRGDGVLEVSEFSHSAIVAAFDLAATGAHEGAGSVDAPTVAPASRRETEKPIAPAAVPPARVTGSDGSGRRR